MDDVPSFANIHMTHCTTIKSHDYSWDGAFMSWVMLLKIICEHRILNSRTMEIYDYTWDGAYVVMDDGCYLKLFAKVRMAHSGSIKIYAYSWDSAYIVMDDAIWNRLQKYAGPTPRPSKFLIMAETVPNCHGRCYLKSFAKVRVPHSRTFKICDHSWDGAHIVMDDAIWNRLQMFA